MRDNDRAFFRKNSIACDMIEMVVRVHNESNGKLGDHTNLAEQSLGSGRVFESIDYRDAVVADHEASVGAGFTFGIVDGGIDTVVEGFEREGESRVGFRRRRRLRMQSWGATASQYKQKKNRSSHGGLS